MTLAWSGINVQAVMKDKKKRKGKEESDEVRAGSMCLHVLALAASSAACHTFVSTNVSQRKTNAFSARHMTVVGHAADTRHPGRGVCHTVQDAFRCACAQLSLQCKPPYF